MRPIMVSNSAPRWAPNTATCLLVTVASCVVCNLAIGGSGRDKLEPEMIRLPGGTFMMGFDGGEADEKPVRQVTVGTFAIGKYEVTRGEFAKFAQATGLQQATGCRYYTGMERKGDPNRSYMWPGFEQTDRHPVVCVSWDEAVAYTQWLSERTGRKYRLPTAEEWEFAARAGERAETYWDKPEEACKFANVSDASRERWVRNDAQEKDKPIPDAFKGFPCDDKFAQTAPVGTFPPNKFGLYDMLGNSWEMIQGCFEYVRGADGKPTDECLRRPSRGGSWLLGQRSVRLANRASIQHDHRNFTIGVRLVMETEQTQSKP
jgi:formylglycine-generating enzyme